MASIQSSYNLSGGRLQSFQVGQLASTLASSSIASGVFAPAADASGDDNFLKWGTATRMTGVDGNGVLSVQGAPRRSHLLSLSADINGSVVSITLKERQGAAPNHLDDSPHSGDVLLVGNEQMFVIAAASITPTTKSLSVTRGINGTTATSHNADDACYVLNTTSNSPAYSDFVGISAIDRTLGAVKAASTDPRTPPDVFIRYDIVPVVRVGVVACRLDASSHPQPGDRVGIVLTGDDKGHFSTARSGVDVMPADGMEFASGRYTYLDQQSSTAGPLALIQINLPS